VKDTETHQHYCPVCGSYVIWSHASGVPGTRTRVMCGNNLAASQTDWEPESFLFCSWKGFAERKKGGKIEIYNADGTRLRRKYKK
tara:strand:- start:677 stop:931 length:255 start_codon:yes stop_codon:yes gene_type:complete